MSKSFTIFGLAAAAIPAVGALLWAQSARAPREAQPAPMVLAMQEPQAPTQPAAARSPLAHVGWIGVILKENKGHGVRVAAVFPGGPAAFAGIRVGDVVARIGSAEVNSTQDAQTAIEHLAPKQPAPVTVERGKKASELKVIPGSMADFQQDYMTEMMRRDPRDPKYLEHHGVSEADMSAELIRRLFEQHERLERAMLELTKEVHALRKQVAALQK